jgi:hydrogenase maturation factor
LSIGGYVVVYAGQALEKMDSGEAEEMLAWYDNLETMLEEAAATVSNPTRTGWLRPPWQA